MDFDLIKFNIASSTKTLLKKTSPIVHNGNKTENWYVADLISTYSSLFHGEHVTPELFSEVISQLDEYILTVNGSNKALSILSKKKNFNKQQVSKIMSEFNENLQQSSKDDFIFLSDDDDGFFECAKPKPVDSYKSVFNEKSERNTQKITNPKETFDSSKSNLTPFEQTKIRITEAFGDGFVIPTSQFAEAYCKNNKVMFNYKKEPCDKYRHPHSSLTKYMLCCSDIIEVVSFPFAYLIKKSPGQDALVEKKLMAHLKSKVDREAFLYHLELLSVNLFFGKVVVPLSDFLKLFNLIYKVSFESLSEMEPSRLINECIKSPNFFVKSSQNQLLVTAVPLSSNRYRDYGNKKLHDFAIDVEKMCLGIRTADYMEEKTYIKTNVSSSEIFGIKDQKICDLLKKADYNIPKLILLPVLEYDHNGIEKIFTSPAWYHLQQNINFDDEPTFFNL